MPERTWCVLRRCESFLKASLFLNRCYLERLCSHELSCVKVALSTRTSRSWFNMSRQQHPLSAFLIDSVCILWWFFPLTYCLWYSFKPAHPHGSQRAHFDRWTSKPLVNRVENLWEWISLSRINLQMKACSYSKAICRHDQNHQIFL